MQVRQPLYKSSVQRWKEYQQQLEPLREALAPLIGRYEQMLAQRLSTPAASTTDTQQQLDDRPDSDGAADDVRDEL